MPATASGDIAAAGNSATTVTCFADDGTFPAVTPPSLRKSLGLRSAALPQPITTRRDALSPAGAMMSSVVPLLPVKPSASAARLTRSAAPPRSLRVAAPILRASSQKTISTPFAGALKRSNSIFNFKDIPTFLAACSSLGTTPACSRRGGAPSCLPCLAAQFLRPHGRVNGTDSPFGVAVTPLRYRLLTILH